MAITANTLNTTYIYFNVLDYTGSRVLSSYTLPQTPLTFVPDFTTSDILSSAGSISNKLIKWNFGDGTFSSELTAVHNYVFPGSYNVTLTIFDDTGKAYDSTYSPEIKIYDFIADTLQWDTYGKFVYDVPASKIGDPLTIFSRNSWQSYSALSASGGITINLYASGAAGDYVDKQQLDQDKWSHLRLLSRFYEKQFINGNLQYVQVESISANIDEIFARIADNKLQICNQADTGSFFVGTTGANQIYYVDDRAKNFTSREPPIFLFATFDNALFEDSFSERRHIFNYIDYPPYGVQNFQPSVLPIIKIRQDPAAYLSITTTGIDGEGTLSSTAFDIPSISWQCTEIPFVIKFKDDQNFTTKTYPPLSSSTTGSILSSVTAFNVNMGIIYTDDDGNVNTLTDVKFYDDFSSDIPQSVGGFYKGYFISNQATNFCTLTASVTVVEQANFPKDSLVGWVSIPQYGYLYRIFKEQIFSSCYGTLTETLTSSSLYTNSYGNNNTLAICVAPSGAGKGNDFQTWFADSINDTVFKIDVYGQTLSSISLSAAKTLINNVGTVSIVDYRDPELQCASPSNIALDSDSNIWVALCDSGYLIKIDGINGNVISIANSPTSNVHYFLSSYGFAPALSGFAGEGLFLPSSVDTDLTNNVWATYSHPVSNILVKYDTYGTLLTVIPFPPVIAPIETCIDRNGYVYVTTFNHNASSASFAGRNDYLYKFDKDGNIYPGYPIGGFRMIDNITIDGSQNAWISHDRETITKVDHFTNNKTDFIAGSGHNQTDYICSLNGIACDTGGYLWAINNYDKQIYVIDTLGDPNSNKPYIVNQLPLSLPPNTTNYPLSDFELNQFQAYGDWFGTRWINKYMQVTSIIRTITGSSATFNIYPSGGHYGVMKINEDFDAHSFYNSLRFQEVLLDKQIFFDQFLKSIVGDIKAQPYELGKEIYERVANFVDNRANIETCNIDALVSLCNELSIQYEQYNYPFPPQLKRVVDMLSIGHKRLWGDKNSFNENFKNYGTYPPQPTSNYGVNLGEQLSTVTGIISTGVPVVAYELFSGIYSIVNFSGIPGVTAFYTPLPLSSYNYNWGWGLVAPSTVSGVDIDAYYNFYTYIPPTTAWYYNNIIDWKNPLTTLSPYNSAYSTWSIDNGIMQNLISYELTKGLRLFTSAADITYNN